MYESQQLTLSPFERFLVDFPRRELQPLNQMDTAQLATCALRQALRSKYQQNVSCYYYNQL